MPQRIPSIPNTTLDLDENATGFADVVKEILDFIRGEIWGTAAFLDTGVDDDNKIPTIRDMKSSSFLDTLAPEWVGTEDGKVSLNVSSALSFTEPQQPDSFNGNRILKLDSNARIPAIFIPDSVRGSTVYNDTIFNTDTEIDGDTQANPTTINLRANRNLGDYDFFTFFFRYGTSRLGIPVWSIDGNANDINSNGDPIFIRRLSTTRVALWQTQYAGLHLQAIVGHRAN